MDPTAFSIVKSEVHRLPCIDDKIQAIVYAQGNFYAEQVGELLMYMSFDDEKTKALQSCVAKLLPATSVGIFPILRAFRSDSSRVQALQLLSGYVTDPMNFAMLNELFPYARDRDTVRGIMTRRASAGPPPVAPSYGPQTVGNPYPYGRPRPKVDPNDPVYRMVDKTVDVVASGIASILAPRPRGTGAVIATPVMYQTTTVTTGHPSAGVVINPGAPGVQVITTGVPPPVYVPSAQYIPPRAPYPQQQYKPFRW